MLPFVASLQYIQLGLVGGDFSLAKCDDKEYIPSYFTLLDHSDVAKFIADPFTTLNEDPTELFGKI